MVLFPLLASQISRISAPSFSLGLLKESLQKGRGSIFIFKKKSHFCTRGPAVRRKGMERGHRRVSGEGPVGWVSVWVSGTAGLMGFGKHKPCLLSTHFYLPHLHIHMISVILIISIFPGTDRHTPELGCPLANHAGLCSCVLISRKGSLASES